MYPDRYLRDFEHFYFVSPWHDLITMNEDSNLIVLGGLQNDFGVVYTYIQKRCQLFLVDVFEMLRNYQKCLS